jgi:hypothetical protein
MRQLKNAITRVSVIEILDSLSSSLEQKLKYISDLHNLFWAKNQITIIDYLKEFLEKYLQRSRLMEINTTLSHADLQRNNNNKKKNKNNFCRSKKAHAVRTFQKYQQKKRFYYKNNYNIFRK